MLTTEEKKVVTKSIARYCEIKNELIEPNEVIFEELTNIVNDLYSIYDTQDDKMEVVSMIVKADNFLHEKGLL